MNQDKLLELAKEAQLIHEFEGLWGVQLTNDINQLTPALTKFAELILASQAQPTPSQSDDERAEFENWVNENNGNDRATKRGAGDSYELMQTHLYWLAWKARAQLSKPQPTPSQSVDFDLDYTCRRIRRLLIALNMADPSNGEDEVLMGCLFSLLGTICGNIERANLSKPQPTSQDSERLKYLYVYYCHSKKLANTTYDQWLANIDAMKEGKT